MKTKEKIKKDEFKCAICGNIYKKEWSDEEAEAELKENWGENASIDESDIVCDDCYKNLYN